MKRAFLGEVRLLVVVVALGAGCSYEGIRKFDSGAGEPPDVHIAVGLNHVGEVTNGLYRTFLKNPIGEVTTNVPLSTAVGCSGAFDPRIVYDQGAQRWYIVAASRVTNPGKLCLAVSTTNDPTGSYFTFQFTVPTALWPDFPLLGFSDDKVTIWTNQVEFTLGTGSPGYGLYVLRKSDLLSGTATLSYFFMGFAGIFQPARSISSTTTQFLVAFAPSAVQVMYVNGVPGVGGGPTVTTQDITPFSFNGTTIQAIQKGTPDTLLIGSGASGSVFRNGKLWAAQNESCVPADDSVSRDCIRLVQLAQSGSTFTLAQNLQHAANGSYYYYPAIAVDSQDNVVMGYGASSASTYPSFYATGRQPGDAAGTLRSPALLAAGQQPYGDAFPNVNRWGDYFGAGEDPAPGLDRQLWVAGQYASVPATRWATRIELVNAGLFD